jgi:hypothetical protein
MRRVTDARLSLVGALPLAAGAAVPVSALADGGTWCPFRAATGLPCPFCGATRAFVLAGHGDARFLDYGAVWVLVAVALVVAGLVRRRPAAGRWTWPAVAGVVAVAWAWALAHADTIAPG